MKNLSPSIKALAFMVLPIFAQAGSPPFHPIQVPTKIADMRAFENKQVIVDKEESIDALIKVRISAIKGAPRSVIATGDGTIECKVQSVRETVFRMEYAAFVSYTNTDDTGHCIVEITSASGQKAFLDLFTPDN